MNKQERPTEIAEERSTLIARICIAQTRVKEPNTQRQNLIMSEED